MYHIPIFQANDVSGATMSEAINDETAENATNDEIQMEDMETNNDGKSPKKWPKFNKFNNGFGFQRFN